MWNNEKAMVDYINVKKIGIGIYIIGDQL